ncbi:MAG: hypothetical protein AB1689_06850 [Thermodesulfobacteriota bacterium]
MTRFRLERLLHLRARLRVLRQIEAERIAAERRRREQARSQLGAEREEALALAAHAAAQGAAGATTLRLAHAYAPALAAREVDAERALADAAERLRTKRADIARERAEERKLTHLEERHRARVAAEATRAEERLLDETILARHARMRREDDGEA